jgi:hypothetical protein
MAKKLKDFEFPAVGTTTRYPWDEWLDGNIWQLTKGDDFPSDAYNFRNGAINAARRKGLKVRTSRSGDVVTIQAVRD